MRFLCSIVVLSMLLSVGVSEESRYHRLQQTRLPERISPSSAVGDLKLRSDDCPEAAAIAPCTCYMLGSLLYLDCTEVEYDAQLANVFQQEFPVKEFLQFRIEETQNLFNLNFSTNGVSFQMFIFCCDSMSIESISEEFFLDSADRVFEITIENSQITSDGFPFQLLSEFPNLGILGLYHARLTETPVIESASLGDIVMARNQISTLKPGDLDGVPLLYQLILEENQLTELKAGSVPFSYATYVLDFGMNQIATIEAGSFYDITSDGSGDLEEFVMRSNQLTELTSDSIPITKSLSIIDFAFNAITTIDPSAFYFTSTPEGEQYYDFSGNSLTTVDEAVFGPLIQYAYELHLEGNPLECGCDIAWLVLDSSSLSKLSNSTTCQSGVLVHQLDPEFFESNCP